MLRNIKHPQVKEVFKSYPRQYREKLLELRQLIFEVASEIEEVGSVVETLKWGEPSYLPKNKNVGTTVRLHWLKSKPDQYGVYFPCSTNLIDRFRKKYGDLFHFEGNRALIFTLKDKIPKKELAECITSALCYHLDKKKKK